MNQQFHAKIESMAFKGYGVARIEGKVVFIPFSATGDEGWIELVEEKKNYAMGRLKKLTQSSPWRVDPPCPYFGVCGGCQWQHIDYSFHGEIKKGIFEEILHRLGRVKEAPIIQVIPSPDSYGYRVRAQLRVKNGRMGYYRERSHQLVDIDRCQISHSLINQIILSLRKELSSFPPLKEIEINVSPEEEKGGLVVHLHSSSRGRKHFAESLLQSCPVLKGVAVIQEGRLTLSGDPLLHYTIYSNRHGRMQTLRLRTSPESFYQVNPDQNQTLLETVLEFAELKREERVLDLYAGIGNLTLPLAAQALEVWGIEENRAAVKDARFNAEGNGIERCGFIQGQVENGLIRWEKDGFDLIVLDPPRTGCRRIVDRVSALNPKRIIYVSCEPTTFARDVSLFSEKGFELRRVTLIDMFPQSYHMEVVGLLTKNSKSQILNSK